MEIEGEDGTKIQLKKRSITEFGRGLGFQFDDRTVSRRHISLEISNFDQKNDKQDGESRVSFQVLGKNPIWVLSNDTKEMRVFRNSEKGELKVGDGFCVSCKNPIFFTLRKIGGFDGKPEEKEGNRDFKEIDRTERIPVDTEMAESTPSEGEVGFDASEINPVKEFGFLKVGHEFDKYPKHRIRGIKDLDWFLEEQKQDSEDDEGNRSRKRKGLGRKKKHNAMEDDDWTGESEDEKVSISKLRMDKRPKYTKTRSKDKNGKTLDVGSSKSSSQKNTIHANEEDEDDETLDEDEDDETLGGFIVDETLDEDEDDETLGGFIVDDEGLDEEEEEEENDEDIIDEEEEEDDDDE
ncbi:hypothetical protein C5167_007154 [Papaver somniferum]|uniref:FHA domain-containing protein n=1 Tax=Papaver somniferum TaxID=3469 RepID=A0A4Y7JIG2_PAPSO|nr:uncharacterized protein DDB_G0283697-like isoform X1 [Papaver somniferum]RZC59852.1 hypothetical protein C5167_007154 [Papaver somniferum]